MHAHLKMSKFITFANVCVGIWEYIHVNSLKTPTYFKKVFMLGWDFRRFEILFQTIFCKTATETVPFFAFTCHMIHLSVETGFMK